MDPEQHYESHVQMGGVPRKDQVVFLGPKAGVQFAARPFHLQLTQDAQVSALEVNEGRTMDNAEWWQLTGWELDAEGQRAIERTVSASVAGIVIVHQSPTVQP